MTNHSVKGNECDQLNITAVRVHSLKPYREERAMLQSCSFHIHIITVLLSLGT